MRIGLLANMWEFPGVMLVSEAATEEDEDEDGDGDEEKEARRRSKILHAHLQATFGSEADAETVKEEESDTTAPISRSLGSVVHVFSHIRQTYYVEHWPDYRPCAPLPAHAKWIRGEQLDTEAIPTGQKKIFALLHGGGGKGSGKGVVGSGGGKGQKKKNSSSSNKRAPAAHGATADPSSSQSPPQKRQKSIRDFFQIV